MLDASGGGNALATNNIDGIVLSASGTGAFRYWDPVSGATGIVGMTGVANYSDAIDISGAGTFDNDRGQYWIFNDNLTPAWFYRISMEPYTTGSAPVIKTIFRGNVYTDNALTMGYSPSGGTFGDAAWDPNSKRIYLSSTNGEFGYVLPYDMRWNPSGLALQVFNQGNVTAGQIAYTEMGDVLYGQTSGGTDVYTIDPVPATATSTLVGSITGGTSCIDASAWPCTVELP